jgi:MFS family permease
MSSGYVTLLSTTARWFKKRRNLMTGIVLIGMSIGTLLAPPISERLISFFNWRTSYLITAIAVAVVVIIAAQFLKRDPASVGQLPDGSQSADEKSADINTQGFTLKEVIKRKQYWFFMIAEICFGFILFSIMVHIVNYALDLRVPDARAAIVLSVMGGFSIIGRVGLGNLADKFGNKRIFFLGLFLMIAALLWLFQSNTEWMLYLFAVVFGIAYGGTETSESPMTAWLFGLKSHGLVFGTLSLGFTVGASLGPLMTGYIFDIKGSYKLAFVILAALGIVGMVFTALLRSLVENPNQTK